MVGGRFMRNIEHTNNKSIDSSEPCIYCPIFKRKICYSERKKCLRIWYWSGKDRYRELPCLYYEKCWGKYEQQENRTKQTP